MEKRFCFVKTIVQTGPTSFMIAWSDGKRGEYRLSDLQKNCRCARCRDEKTGRLQIDLSTLDPEVQAEKIFSVGRYALKIEFTSGCSKGIYPFTFLYNLMDV